MRNPGNNATSDRLSGQFRLAPVGDRYAGLFRRQTGQRDDGANLLRRERRLYTRTRPVRQTNRQRRHSRGIIPAFSPCSYRFRPNIQLTGSLADANIICAKQNHAGTQRQLLGCRVRSNQTLKLSAFFGGHFHRCRGQTGHRALITTVKIEGLLILPKTFDRDSCPEAPKRGRRKFSHPVWPIRLSMTPSNGVRISSGLY